MPPVESTSQTRSHDVLRVCHSCNEREIFSDRESGQAVFTRHVDHQHEAVLERLEVPSEAADLARGGTSTAPDPRDGETEAAGSHSVD